METTRAVCGLDCTTCPVFQVTNAPEGELSREAVARQWSALYGKTIAPEELVCQGCRSDVLYAGCVHCPIRDCAAQKGCEWCGDCPEYPCQRLNQMYAFNERNKTGVRFYEEPKPQII